MKQAEIARRLGKSKQRVHEYVGEGMPTESVGAALAWLRAHYPASAAKCERMKEADLLAKEGAGVMESPVSRYMVPKPVICTRSASVNELMELMTNRRFRHVPVVEGERLVGMVSIGDIVKHRLAEIEAEHRALRDYIATA